MANIKHCLVTYQGKRWNSLLTKLHLSYFFNSSIDATYSKREEKYANNAIPSNENAKMIMLNIDEQPVLALFASRDINRRRKLHMIMALKICHGISKQVCLFCFSVFAIHQLHLDYVTF